MSDSPSHWTAVVPVAPVQGTGDMGVPQVTVLMCTMLSHGSAAVIPVHETGGMHSLSPGLEEHAPNSAE